MPRYVAFLRGVSPQNAKMPELKRCFEKAGFTDVRTLLSSGNIIFDARSAAEPSLERRAESSMQDLLGRSFYTIVRQASHLRALVETDPYAAFSLPLNAKRVISFLRSPHDGKVEFPIKSDGACVLSMVGREVFTAYVPSPRGPVFMMLIAKVFGVEVTTRTWETVKKCAAA